MLITVEVWVNLTLWVNERREYYSLELKVPLRLTANSYDT